MTSLRIKVLCKSSLTMFTHSFSKQRKIIPRYRELVVKYEEELRKAANQRRKSTFPPFNKWIPTQGVRRELLKGLDRHACVCKKLLVKDKNTCRMIVYAAEKDELHHVWFSNSYVQVLGYSKPPRLGQIKLLYTYFWWTDASICLVKPIHRSSTRRSVYNVADPWPQYPNSTQLLSSRHFIRTVVNIRRHNSTSLLCERVIPWTSNVYHAVYIIIIIVLCMYVCLVSGKEYIIFAWLLVKWQYNIVHVCNCAQIRCYNLWI